MNTGSRKDSDSRARAKPPKPKQLYQLPQSRHSRPTRSVVVKTLAIPYIKAPGSLPRFLIVLDRATKEWSFISGCCKLNERPDACVLRELREETKDAVSIWFTAWNYRHFELQAEDSSKVCIHYHCYVIDISNYRPQNDIIEHFRNSKKTGKCYNENTDIAFTTLENFKERKIWPFIKKDVLDCKEFKLIYANICRW